MKVTPMSEWVAIAQWAECRAMERPGADVASLREAYQYDALDTCATDGLSDGCIARIRNVVMAIGAANGKLRMVNRGAVLESWRGTSSVAVVLELRF